MGEHQNEEVPPDYAVDLNDLWSDEGCDWRIEHHGGAGAWVVIMAWTHDGPNEHDAFWTTLTWQFYGDTVDEALAGAVGWCWDLNPWRQCRECDGNGSWQGLVCEQCEGTGFTDPSLFDSSGEPS